jgi:hypothetical protein
MAVDSTIKCIGCVKAKDSKVKPHEDVVTS